MPRSHFAQANKRISKTVAETVLQGKAVCKKEVFRKQSDSGTREAAVQVALKHSELKTAPPVDQFRPVQHQTHRL